MESNMKGWKKEFLTKTDLEKWIGLRKENLDKYGLVYNDGFITDIESKEKFYIDTNSCMLCYTYYNHKKDSHCCESCPLFKLDNLGCLDVESHFELFLNTDNPEPMIESLTAIKDQLPLRNREVNK